MESFQSNPNLNGENHDRPNRFCIILVMVCGLLCCDLLYSRASQARDLTIACYKDYRPYAYLDNNGEVVGLLVDFWNLWAEKNDITLDYVPGYLSQSLERIRTGDADVMIGLFRSKEREQFLDFSIPMMEIATNLYVSQKMRVEGLNQLGDTPVGVIEEDFAVSFLAKRHPDIKTTLFPGSNALIKEVLAGKLDAFALDFPNAIFLMAEHDSITRFRLLETLYRENLRSAVTKGNAELLKLVNQGIKGITSQEVKTLYNKWGLIPKPLILRYKSWIVTILVILLGGCVGFGVYIFRLKTRFRKIGSAKKRFDKKEWLTLIDGGEGENVEFKSSLRWNLTTLKTDKILEFVIVKTLSSFLNTNGGDLFIGVDDQGHLLGLEADYQTFRKKPNRDGFQLKLSNLISQGLGRQSHRYITMRVQNIDGADICRLTVKPGHKPVFVKDKGKESFYIRAGASSVAMSMSEAHEYISSRFKQHLK